MQSCSKIVDKQAAKQIETKNSMEEPGGNSSHTDFEEEELPMEFQSLREPLGSNMSLTQRPGFLRLYGQQSIASLHSQTMAARRWQSTAFTARTSMQFWPVHYNQMAGLTCFYNTENYCYAYVSYDEERECRILDVLVCTLGETSVALGHERISIPEEAENLNLAVTVNEGIIQFYYGFDEEAHNLLGNALSADRLSDDYIGHKNLVFTGSMVGICAQDMYNHTAYADFDSFTYEEHR